MQTEILKKIIVDAKAIVGENPQYPISVHVYLSMNKAIQLAKTLNADVEIVTIGTLLMDCEIGKAIKEGRIKDHVQLSLEKTRSLLDKYSELDKDVRLNIEKCVEQHHGVEKFHSIESEICCNADCYRFASTKGVALGIRYFRDYEFEELLTLLESKLVEKHNAITLDSCKKELDPQYPMLKEYFRLAKQ